MEDLTKRCGKMSLNDIEGGQACLKKELGVDEYIIAAKFQTKRVQNIEAIIWTFSPLWRSRNGFKVKSAGDYIILFVFKWRRGGKNFTRRVVEFWQTPCNSSKIWNRYSHYWFVVWQGISMGASTWYFGSLFESRCNKEVVWIGWWGWLNSRNFRSGRW